MPEQLRQVVERVDSVQFARVNQTHEQIAHPRSVHRLIEEGILPVQDCLLQCPFDDVVVERGAFLPQEQRQLRSVPEQVRYCFAQPGVRFRFVLCKLVL
jgi:hypothetical protein